MKAALVVVLMLVLAGCGQKEEQAEKPVVAVKVARVERATVPQVVRAPATVYPREQASVAARITAPIRELRARMGEEVTAGQVLAVLENRDLAAQLQEAEAAVTDARVTLERLQSGTLPSDVEKARGQVAVTKAALGQAQQIYDRRRQLFQEGAIPERDLLVAQTDLARARADYEVARKSLDLFQNQSRERDIQIAQSKLEQAEARLAASKAQLEFSEIRSPFAGTITAQYQYAGDMAKPDAPMFTVMDLGVVVARAQVPADDAGAVKPGQHCRFLPDFAGRVSAVSKAIDPARRTVEVWCEIPNPKRALRGNVFGEVEIETGSDPESLVAPLAAVQFEEGSSKGSVLVVDAKRLAHLREVETGRKFDGKVQIRSGVAAGDLVVVEGGYGLADGTEVRW
jgi:multidrug efflux pump subunit AcrA (membrane-fusion protein)